MAINWIFDFDGVIVDSERLHYAAFVETLGPFGFTATFDEYVARYVGLDDESAARAMIVDSGGDAARARELLGRKIELMRRWIEDGRILKVAGALEFIEAASKRGPVSVCSAARGSEVHTVLERFGIHDWFATIVTADDVTRTKPDPEGYRRVMELTNASPGDCVVFEDSGPGIEAARSAGARVIGITSSSASDRLSRADFVWPHFLGVRPEDALERLGLDQ
ncbi:MAG: HAD family hydrolase [Phycisphaerales bacterium]